MKAVILKQLFFSFEIYLIHSQSYEKTRERERETTKIWTKLLQTQDSHRYYI